MTAKQKEQLFLGTILIEVIAIFAVGFALFSPLWEGSDIPELPPVVDRDIDEPPTVVLPELATDPPENGLPGPILTVQETKAALHNSVIGLCLNYTGSPACVGCDEGATPPTTCSTSGTSLHCLINMNTHKCGGEQDNESFDAKYTARDIGAPGASGGGCSTCGGGAGSGPDTSWPRVELARSTSPRRSTEVSSFGPGTFCNYDLQLHLYEDGGGLVIDLVDPKELYVRRHRDGLDYQPANGVFENPMVKTTNGITLLGSSGTPVTSMNDAVGAKLETCDGTVFEFEFFSNTTTGVQESGFPVADPPSGGSPTEYPVLEGRVTSIKDANGYGVDLEYKQWTAQEISESPDRQWQLNQVTDSSGQSMTMSYASAQVSGRWVISSVTGPDGGTTSYEYTSGMLSRVVRPTGDESTFTYTVDNDSQATVMSVSDPALGSCAVQSVYLTNNFLGKSYATDNGDVYNYMSSAKIYNTSSLLVRLVTNGEGEVEYFNFPFGYFDTWVYEGGGKLRSVMGYTNSTYYGSEWEFNAPDPNETYDASGTFSGPPVFSGVAEATYASSNLGGMSTYLPGSTWDETGRSRNYEFEGDLISKVTYPDNSFEMFAYNEQKKVTRRQDRDGNVTLYTYDSRGNVLTKEVGLVALSSVGEGDTYADGWHDGYYDALAEHQSGQYGSNYKASYDGTTPEYDQGYEDGYAAGSGSQTRSLFEGLNFGGTAYAQEHDPEHGGDPPPPDPGDLQTPEYALYQYEYYAEGHQNQFLLSAEIDPNGNRTDYEYNANNLLIKIKHPADESGGTRPETTFTYDTVGRLKTSTDPVGRTTEQFYDARGRVDKILYGDGSTERFFFGTGAESGLLVKQKDRSGVVADYEYDSAGRRTRIVYAAATMDLADNETAITDPSITSEETITYVPGTTQVATRTRDGQTTSYAYDYRGRVIETTVTPRVGQTLTSTTYYVNNEVFAREDAYGRKTYYAYRASDGALIREVRGTHPGFSLADENAVLNYTRTADPDGNGEAIVTDYLLDDDGQQIEVIDGRGMSSTTVYDSRGRVVESVAGAGTAAEAKTVTVYDTVGNVTEIQHPRHFDLDDPVAGACRTVMTYTNRNLLKTRTEAAGTAEAATETYTYFLDGRLDTRTDARNNDWETVWATCCARRQATIDPLDDGTISNTDYQGRATHAAVVEDVASHTNLNNPIDAKTLSETTTRYDARGRVAARTVWLTPLGAVDPNAVPIAGLAGVPSSDGLTTQMLYDSDLTDGVGLDSATGQSVAQLGGGTYNVSIAAVITKLADTTANGGAGITFGTDCPGSAVVSINPEEEIRVSISDALGRNVCSAVIEPHDGTTPGALLTWNCVLHDAVVNITGFGDVLETASIGAGGNVTRQRTDGAGRTLQSIDAEDYVTNITYDASGNQLTVRDGNNVGQDCTYDALGRRIQCADTQELTESVSRSWQYDLAGNVIAETDAKGKDTVHVYDTRGRKTSTTDRLAGVTAWAYDAAGNLLSLTDAENQTTSYEYDAAGRKIKETYPDHVTGSSVGSLDYGIVEFSYDPAGRLSVKTDQQGDTCTYNYDLAGRLTSRDYVGHASGPLAGQSDSDTFTYDAAARMLTATSGRYSNTVTFTYDDVGRRATESLTIYGQTYTVGTDYDEEGQVSQLTYPDGTLVQRAYTPRGQLQQITYDSQVIDTRQYDAGGRMTQRTLGNGLVETRTYRSDNLTATINTPGVTAFSYTYDANKNKTAETIGGVMQPYGYTATYDDEDRLASWTRDDSSLTQSWNLSPVGDWASFTENTLVENRTHGPTHELTAIDSTPLTYDAKGNLTTNSNGQTYTWDFDNKMSSVHVPAGCPDGIEGTHTYEYDALRRRVGKGSDESTIVLVRSRERVVSEYEAGTASIGNVERYVHGSYVDDPVLADKTSGRIYYHSNGIHTVAAVTDDTGGVIERYRCNAFGELQFLDPNGDVLADQMSVVNNHRTYTGRTYDRETRLYHFRARYFSPRLGFLSRDPLSYSGGGTNLYSYVMNSPLVYVDPFGLSPFFHTDMHWFPQGLIRGLEQSKCGPMFEELGITAKWFTNLFTTRFFERVSGYRRNTCHWFIHEKLDDGKYNLRAEDIYSGSKSCCELLTRMLELIGDAQRDILNHFYGWSLGKSCCPLPSYPVLHPHKHFDCSGVMWTLLQGFWERACRPPLHLPPLPYPFPQPEPKNAFEELLEQLKRLRPPADEWLETVFVMGAAVCVVTAVGVVCSIDGPLPFADSIIIVGGGTCAREAIRPRPVIRPAFP